MGKQIKRINKYAMPDQFAKELEDEIDEFFDEAEKIYIQMLSQFINEKNKKAVQFNER